MHSKRSEHGMLPIASYHKLIWLLYQSDLRHNTNDEEASTMAEPNIETCVSRILYRLP